MKILVLSVRFLQFSQSTPDINMVQPDWIQDSLHERNLRAKGPPNPNALASRLDNLEGAPGYVWKLMRQVFQEGQTWVVITLTGNPAVKLCYSIDGRSLGIGIGISAALISVITVWLSDKKMGYCTTGWWLSQKFCCLEVSDEGEDCAEWRNWGGVEPFQWFFYVLFAVSGLRYYDITIYKQAKSFPIHTVFMADETRRPCSPSRLPILSVLSLLMLLARVFQRSSAYSGDSLSRASWGLRHS